MLNLTKTGPPLVEMMDLITGINFYPGTTFGLRGPAEYSFAGRQLERAFW